MFVEDAKIGMKVVPVSRTILVNGDPEPRKLTSSLAYQKMLQVVNEIGAGYLRISKIDEVQGRLLCHPEFFPSTADWFMDYDLVAEEATNEHKNS